MVSLLDLLLPLLGIGSFLLSVKQEISPADVKTFSFYLWVSLSIQSFVLATVVLLFRAYARMREGEIRALSHARAQELAMNENVKVRDSGYTILHRLAEEVRRCVINDGQTSCQDQLQYLLGPTLRGYLQSRLPTAKGISITVKRIEKTGTDMDLSDVFRDREQDAQRRPISSERLGGNYVYQSFVRKVTSKWLMVRDTSRLDAENETLRDRAKRREYKSLIAFPLNAQIGDKAANISPLVGFLGIDAKSANAFDGLFVPRRDDGVIVSNTGEDQSPTEEMNLLYGIADSIATIIGLNIQHQRSEDNETSTDSSCLARQP